MNSKMKQKQEIKSPAINRAKIGQGFNDSRGEIEDQKDIPAHNGQNLNNDPAHRRGNENNEIKHEEKNV